MITAAAVMIRPVRSSPSATARSLSWRLVPLLAHPADEEDLVVHREAEEHREQEDRDPALDLRELVEAEHVLPEPEAEDEHERAVGGRDREQVQDHRLQRQDQRAERAHQQQVREQEHGEHEPRERAVGDVQEVDALRRSAAGHARRRRPGTPRPGSARRAAGGRRPGPPPSRTRASSRRSPGHTGRSGRRSGRRAGSTRPPPPGRASSSRDEPADRRLHRRARRRRPACRCRRAPAPARSRRARARACSTFRPRTDCGYCGMPAVAPGVSWSQATGIAPASEQRRRRDHVAPLAAHDRARHARPEAVLDVVRFASARSNRQPQPLAEESGHRHATRAAAPVDREQRRLKRRRGERSRRPGAGSPPMPIARMNGSGMKISSASPIATVAPEKITARPAVCIVRTIGRPRPRSPRASSSRKR